MKPSMERVLKGAWYIGERGGRERRGQGRGGGGRKGGREREREDKETFVDAEPLY